MRASGNRKESCDLISLKLGLLLKLIGMEDNLLRSWITHERN